MEDEDWSALAQTVVDALEPIGEIDNHAMDSPLANSIQGASDALRQRRDDVARFRSGHPDVQDPLNQPAIPAVDLGRAIVGLGRQSEVHSRAGRVFSLYGEHLGRLRPTERRQGMGSVVVDVVLQGQGQDQVGRARWDALLRSRTEVFRGAREVRHALRLAAALDLAVMDAVDVARMLPAGSLHWTAWMLTAEQLAVLAEAQASSALAAAHRMHSAVARESRNAALALNYG